MIEQPRNSDNLVHCCKCRTFAITKKMLLSEPEELMRNLKYEEVEPIVLINGTVEK